LADESVVLNFMTRCALFVIRDSSYFLSHRVELATFCLNQGWAVSLLTDVANPLHQKNIESLGLNVIHAPFLSVSKKPWQLIVIFLTGIRLFRRQRFHIIFSVTIFANFIASLLSMLFRVPQVALIAGLGNAFHSKSGFKGIVAKLVYRLSFNRKHVNVIVQNPDVRDVLLSSHISSAPKISLIAGSGVDTNLFSFKPYPHSKDGRMRVAFVGRLLREKGLVEFIEAARKIKDAEFFVIGDVDLLNPTSVNRAELEQITVGMTNITFLGRRGDIAALLQEYDVVCLPSYHEGLPKALLEAGASGCAVIGSDIPGCRMIIKPNHTGLLVGVGSSDDICIAIETLMQNPELARALSRNVREFIEDEMSSQKIIPKYFDVLQKNAL
jgi:glycosyltransferase involved in cell wall biosynthesis